ncbi:MAG: DUF6288 domain-containing protein [Planctomycetota bacterium]
MITRSLRFVVTTALCSILIGACPGRVEAQPESAPDLTDGDAIPVEAKHDWNLGATGVRGWMFSTKLVTTEARQIAVTRVEPGSPADGVLAVGDVILGSGNENFSFDPRTEFGRALTRAEQKDGRLDLLRWRDGKTERVTLSVPVLGKYSATAPYKCEKSAQILVQGCAALAKRIGEESYRPNPIPRALNALALLASGDAQYIPIVRSEAEWAANFSAKSFQTWYYGYVLLFLAEYAIATGDATALPGVQRLALEAANGQSRVGSWGHRFAQPSGRLAGYGMMNSPGIPLTIALILAREAGVDDPAVTRAIDRSAKLIRFYAGKGAVPYGDHHPWIETHEDNGKCGMAAVLFDLLGEQSTAEFFTRMSVASHGAERDTGHTGNYFNLVWALPGVSRAGPKATGSWMEAYGAWSLDLARQWDGTFRHQGPPQQKHDSYRGWDSTGAFLLAYALPKRATFLTGKRKSSGPQLTRKQAASLLEDGRGWDNRDRRSLYDGLNTEQLLDRLESWSPVVRERAAMALGRRKGVPIPPLIEALSAEQLSLRYGACQALAKQRKRGAAAVPALLAAIESDDLWLRVLAADALAGIGEPAKGAVPALLERLARPAQPDDPRGMEQRYLSFALFNRRGGLIGRSLDGVDRDLLLTAVRSGLQNEDGRARGSFATVYDNLLFEELEPLLPAIHRAIVEPAPSGIMFADTIRTKGLELFAKHHVSQGIELLADYAKNQKPHGSEKRIGEVMAMLQSYGTHAQRVIPELESVANYFENEEQDFPKKLSRRKAQSVRDAIVAIRSATETPKLIDLNL